MIYSVKLFTFIVTFVTIADAKAITEEEIHLVPKLFHLDGYDRCLSAEDGLYCVATFDLASKTENNTVYTLLRDNQDQSFSFDRKLLHRGYCLSSRCPSEELNTTLRFERCVSKHLRKYALTAHLKNLSYCRTHAERKARETQPPDFLQKLFLYVVYFILFLNVLGTLYGVFANGKKNSLLLAWSLPANWKSLTTVDESASSTFTSIHGFKVIMYVTVIYAHSTLLHYLVYVYNPEAMQKASKGTIMTIIRNGTSFVQVFILIASFLTAYSILVTTRRSGINAKLVMGWILKRIFRIAPVYLLVIGYVATWLPRAGDGPFWPTLVDIESNTCRMKFWAHVFFVNNIVDPTELCLLQSWAMAAEIQLFLVSLLLTVLFIKLRVRAAPILGMMFIACCVFNVALTYFAGLLPMVKIIVPESLRLRLRGSRSLFHFHMSPLSNLPACLFGLLVAHMYIEQQNKKAKREDDKTNSIGGDNPNESNTQDTENRLGKESTKDNQLGFRDGMRNRKNLAVDTEASSKEQKSNEVRNEMNLLNTTGNENSQTLQTKRKEKQAPFLLRYAHYITLPSITLWVMLGIHIQNVDSKPIIAFYVGMERVVFSVMYAWLVLQLVTIKGPLGRLMSWRGWVVPSRLHFCVVMVHWSVNVIIVATRPQPIVSSLFDISIDWAATMFYSYLIALPLSLLVEVPMKKVLDALIS